MGSGTGDPSGVTCPLSGSLLSGGLLSRATLVARASGLLGPALIVGLHEVKWVTGGPDVYICCAGLRRGERGSVAAARVDLALQPVRERTQIWRVC